ncbi:hypothetical protein BGY98DRAFT_1015654 [Russula aff. rugulosa BPL654]|nr:hypothetical protein BGY98DRAFT_1015654 [Russula aff. rugulosa BPL654]
MRMACPLAAARTMRVRAYTRREAHSRTRCLKYRSHILYLFKLEHLSNGFKKIPGSRPLKVGDVCRGLSPS